MADQSTFAAILIGASLIQMPLWFIAGHLRRIADALTKTRTLEEGKGP